MELSVLRNNLPSHGGKPGDWRLDGYTDSCALLAGWTISSSSGIVMSESAMSWSPGPPSTAGTCPQWCKALPMVPAESHSARAEGFDRTERAMAAVRRRRANLDVMLPPAMK